ncbi:MerR family transcriptional regulator [Flavivirga rizhaonensis]|uniref:MerR family transcriptional regulator n=1 Tax=Flavivirga rizhaonensis TaxID=2559571 RepID=A0A4S1DZ36_9FLAO|nr:MerR family transcriptional regulator [Flavivirga rizhaonensis]TGV03581.1 MerR family transcriptional regulator [Flavivirga rizhaonensis]
MNKQHPDYTKIAQLLNQQIYSPKYIVGVTKQLLTYWQEKGLLEDKRNQEKGWSKFSLLDILWMSIILELRSFGLPNDKIKKVRNAFFEKSTSDKNPELNQLILATIHVITYATPIFLVIDAQGNVSLLNDYDYVNNLKEGTIKNHIVVSLNQTVNENIEPLFSEPNFNTFTGLSKDEIQVLLIIRGKNFQSIKITKKNGEIDMIEGTERISEQNRIIDILKQHDYQDIELKQANGKLVYITRTVKTKTK